jgi:uncharacterized membrane-anchored protein
MKTKTRLGFILIVLFQVLILVGWTGYNEVSLATGKEVVLQTVPVDPMDIFRGEYVQLRYTISTLSNIPGIGTIHFGDKVYVHLEQDGEVWKATEVAKNKNADWEYFIAGKMESGFGDRVSITASITYGIEAYFVPEGKGMAIQTARDIKVRVTIDHSGKAFILGLIVDGKPFQLH